MQEKQEKEQQDLQVGDRIKNKRSGEAGVIFKIKGVKLFINYSSYSCGGKVFGVRFRWAHKDNIKLEEKNEDQ